MAPYFDAGVERTGASRETSSRRKEDRSAAARRRLAPVEASCHGPLDHMLKVGLIGWRGMVGSVLLERMRAERDLDGVDAAFFSTSSPGGAAPDFGQEQQTLLDAFDTESLQTFDVLLTCQGGDYSTRIHPELRKRGWEGYWIDAARALRMSEEAVLVLDPINRKVIERGLARGHKTYCGANCTVSLLLMALAGLFEAGQIEWVSTMTYQAASGAGANQMRELVAQMAALGKAAAPLLDDPATSALDIDRAVARAQASSSFPTEHFGVPLAGSLLPWIDAPVELGQSREEWKGHVEANKILGLSPPVAVDGLCVRVGSMRCHAQGVTAKLKAAVPMDEITDIIRSSNDWVRIVDNTPAATLAELTPAAVTGTLTVPVGRLRKMRMGDDFLSAFTVGDQLLWGAAEPLRRMLAILREHLGR